MFLIILGNEGGRLKIREEYSMSLLQISLRVGSCFCKSGLFGNFLNCRNKGCALIRIIRGKIIELMLGMLKESSLPKLEVFSLLNWCPNLESKFPEKICPGCIIKLWIIRQTQIVFILNFTRMDFVVDIQLIGEAGGSGSRPLF
jgi:hypothetical protein